MATGFGEYPWEVDGATYDPTMLGGVGLDGCNKQQGDTKTPEPDDTCTPEQN